MPTPIFSAEHPPPQNFQQSYQYPKISSCPNPALHAPQGEAVDPQMAPCNASQQLYFDMCVRLALLERDLEHCRAQKAEAEITVLHLAQLSVTKRLPPAKRIKPDRHMMALRGKLAQTTKEKKMVQARLKRTSSLLSALIGTKGSSPSLAAPCRATSTKLSNTAEGNENLIDLTSPEFVAGPTGDETCLSDRSHDGDYGLERGSCSTKHMHFDTEGFSTPSSSFSSDLSNSSYIIRFANQGGQFTNGACVKKPHTVV